MLQYLNDGGTYLGTTFSLITFILLLVLTAFFVATEFAIVKVRATRIEQLSKAGESKALAAKKVVNHLDEYLAACQLGITITALGIGMVGESTFEFILHPLFSSIGIPEAWIHPFTIVGAFIIATFLHVVVGEMAPKTIAIQKAEAITLRFAKPIIFFYRIMYPFIWILNGAARIILKMFNMKPAKESEVFHSEEELKQLIYDSHEGGEINESELHHINQAFKFDNLVAKDVMIERQHVKTLDISTSFQEVMHKIKTNAYTRYPAIKNNEIVGFIHSKSLFNVEQPTSLEHFVNPMIQAKMETPLKHILEVMKKKKVHIAAVYHASDFQGIITLENILEEIVGDIEDEYN